LCIVTPLFIAALNSRFPKIVRYISGVCIGLATLSVFLTVSRAGVPIFGFVLLGTTAACASLRFTFKKVFVAFAVCIGFAILVLKFWGTLKERYQEATLSQ